MKTAFSMCGNGDYYIPNLTVPDEKTYNIGKYGNLRKDFLKDYHQSFYTVLFMEGKLFELLAEIDETCHNCLNDMISKMTEQEGVTEQLKATEEKIVITENLIGSVLDEVQSGLGYADASAKSNVIIFNAWLDGNTVGYAHLYIYRQ